ncbi:ABC transporter ATP-binding protein [Clostridia bacterium]|nr:ABC transporter ATP-binding protein [Clostridia bacterium]
MNLLDVKRIHMSFAGLQVLKDISFSLAPDEILGVIGPNGAGKTTLFNLITGFYKPPSGTIAYDGEDITGLPSDKITAKGINRTFQNVRLFASQTVLENVLVGMGNKIEEPLFQTIFRTNKIKTNEIKAKKAAFEILETVGLTDLMKERAGNLSYGNQRRLELARALANEPKLLLLDEPTAGMNPQEAVEIIGLVQSIRKPGMSILIIEHNMRVVMNLSERIICIEAGSKIADGTPYEIQHDQAVITAYLGESTN